MIRIDKRIWRISETHSKKAALSDTKSLLDNFWPFFTISRDTTGSVRRNECKRGRPLQNYNVKSSQFTEVFARKLCENGVVALTFANWKTKDPDEENVLTYYLNEKELWEKEIDKFLASLK
ncbi:hypothetical protein pdam_00025322, partial [Pocillopora damicornis]